MYVLFLGLLRGPEKPNQVHAGITVIKIKYYYYYFFKRFSSFIMTMGFLRNSWGFRMELFFLFIYLKEHFTHLH